jgi:DNA-binding SARP family transcriptional activator
MFHSSPSKTAEMTDTCWDLTLLGGVELRGGSSAAAESILVQPKHVGLLAFLEIERTGSGQRRFSRRDYLVGLLWPELDQPHARTALRRVVHQIRTALGSEMLKSRGDEELAVGEAQLRSDVGEFTAALANSQLAHALELYAGDLMPGFHLSGCAEFERWLDGRRDHFRREAGAAAWALAQRLEADSDLSLAGQVVRRAVEFAWDDERMLRRAIEMLARLGDKSGGLSLYSEFCRRLRADFDAEPSPETSALAERLRRRES